jgi:hypothetical protein
MFSKNIILTEIQINLFKFWKKNSFVKYLHPLLTHLLNPMMPQCCIHSYEAKEIEESVLPVHKYNVHTFSPFAITDDHLVTFHTLYVNMDIQPSLSNFPFEIRFFLYPFVFPYSSCSTHYLMYHVFFSVTFPR